MKTDVNPRSVTLDPTEMSRLYAAMGQSGDCNDAVIHMLSRLAHEAGVLGGCAVPLRMSLPVSNDAQAAYGFADAADAGLIVEEGFGHFRLSPRGEQQVLAHWPVA